MDEKQLKNILGKTIRESSLEPDRDDDADIYLVCEIEAHILLRDNLDVKEYIRNYLQQNNDKASGIPAIVSDLRSRFARNYLIIEVANRLYRLRKPVA